MGKPVGVGGRELGTRRPTIVSLGCLQVIDLCLSGKNNIKSNLRESRNNRRVLCLEAQIETDFEKRSFKERNTIK